MNRPTFHACRGVAFDCYGTLLNIADDRRVTRRATAILASSDAPSPLRNDFPLSRLLIAAGASATEAEAIEVDALAEAQSAVPLPGAVSAIALARNMGLRTAVASNLSREYAAPIRRTFPDLVHCFSFDIGVIKPDPSFYLALCRMMSLYPDEVVMIGDSRRCDYDGAIAAGLHAILIGKNCSCTGAREAVLMLTGE